MNSSKNQHTKFEISMTAKMYTYKVCPKKLSLRHCSTQYGSI